jgi:hypothetical protein
MEILMNLTSTMAMLIVPLASTLIRMGYLLLPLRSVAFLRRKRI